MDKHFKNIIFLDTYNQQKPQMNISDVEKLEQAIEVHGYRGPSKKKHNGVVPIRPTDNQLWKALDKYKELESDKIELLINNGNEHIADVKIVAHVTTGDRAIGCVYKNNSDDLTLCVLGFANYNKKLF